MQRIDALSVINGIQDLLNKNKKKIGEQVFRPTPLNCIIKKNKPTAKFLK